MVKDGFTKITLVFKEIDKTMVKVQPYICKRCDKTFQTDLSSLVDKNSNFTNELKSESEHLISDYLGSLKNVCKSFKKFFGISVSHQTIKNWLFVNENIHLDFYLIFNHFIIVKIFSHQTAHFIFRKWQFFFFINHFFFRHNFTSFGDGCDTSLKNHNYMRF